LIPRVRVLRRPIKSRDSLKGLTGFLYIRARTITPVHVGREEIGRIKALSHQAIRNSVQKVLSAPTHEKAVLAIQESLKEIFRPSRREAEVTRLFRLRGFPSIPGSCMKGVVRSRIEFMFKESNGVVPSCFSVIGGRPFKATRGHVGWRHQAVYPSSLEDRGLPCDATRYETVCDVCNIFGAPGLASRVEFSPLIFKGKTETLSTPFGMLEVIKSGMEAKGAVSFKNMEQRELGLLLLGLGIENGPILIGRSKFLRVGGIRLGRIQIKAEKWSFYETSTEELASLGFKGSLELEGEEADRLARMFIEKARTSYAKWLRELNEDEVIRGL